MNVICIIQARMGSTRFPGKVLALLGDHPVIWHVYTRCREAVPNTVVAIPGSPENAQLADYLRREVGATVFWWDGPENDVLGRYAACLKVHPAEWVVRVTGDCPLVEPDEIRSLVAQAQRFRAPYLDRSVPRGLNVEVYLATALLLSERFDTDAYRREHVKLMPVEDIPNLSVDTPADLDRIRALMEKR